MQLNIDETRENAVLCWLATCGRDGQPNVSPKEIWHWEQKRFVIADIASAGSIRAIRDNPKVCVSLIDIFRETGHKLIGTAQIHEGGTEAFDRNVAPLRDKAGPDFPIRNVIDVQVQKLVPILAPSWRVFPERDAEDHIRRSHATYRVRPE